jgi:hypothetical protein
MKMNIQKTAKTCALILAFAIPVAFCVMVGIRGKQERKGAPLGLTPTPTTWRHPLQVQMLATLKHEHLDQSLTNIIDDLEQYDWPFMTRAGIDEQQEIENILATRRFAKVLQGIKKLSQKEGDLKCETLFDRGFRIHTNICRARTDQITDPSAPGNHQSVGGPLSGMSAAMFIEADTARLDLLERQFAMLVLWRTEIEPLAGQPNRKIPAFPVISDSVITPDRRLQVNVLRLAALRSGNAKKLKEVDDACAAINMKTKKFPLVPWDAETTHYEIVPNRGLDTSKGVTEYLLYDWSLEMNLKHARHIGEITPKDPLSIDEEQEFIKKLESIVFSKK